ncbi:MAG: ABC transporter ATP-binding protein [Kouleothrix sp.]
MVAFGQLTTIVVIVVGGIGIVHATLNTADLLTYVLCIGILFEPLERLVNFARLYQEGITSFHRFMDLLEVPPSITEAPDAIELGLVQGQIHFNNVSFGYKAHYGAVLRDISLHIRAGEYIAFIGFSGVGETTLYRSSALLRCECRGNSARWHRYSHGAPGIAAPEYWHCLPGGITCSQARLPRIFAMASPVPATPR